jgi:uridine kinase
MSNNLTFTSDAIVNNIMNQNYKYYWLNEEMKNVMATENRTYDVVVKLRPDLHILDPLDFTTSLNVNKVYLPMDSKIDLKKLKNAEDNYICDILAYGTPTIMNVYLGFYSLVMELVKKHGNVNETLLYHYLLQQKISWELVDIKFMLLLSRCHSIAITGDSGSGKTTISTILKELFQNSFLLECDRYHKWERSNENWAFYTHLNPAANYLTKMQQDVFDLKMGNTIYQVDYDHTTGSFTDKTRIEPAEHIIICGLHSLYLTDTMIDLKIYMDTDENLRIPWKIKRDIQKRGYSIEKILDQINSRTADFHTYIYPQKKDADIIIQLYTDKPFTVATFSLEEDLNMYLKIGVKKKYSTDRIIQQLTQCHINIVKIVLAVDDDFLYFHFENLVEYKSIIKAFVLQLK